MDGEDDRVCELGRGSGDSVSATGQHWCPHDTKLLDASAWRWCGSNFDALGNDRFGVRSAHSRRSAGYTKDLL